MAFRVINVFVFAFGTAALAAAISVYPLTSNAGSTLATSILIFVFAVALTSLLTAVAAFLLIPATAEIVRQRSPGEDSAPAPLSISLVILGAIGVLQLPALLGWWNEDRMLLRELTGGVHNPPGLELVPAMILMSMPVLAGLTLLLFVISTALGVLLRSELTFRMLAACTTLMSGLAVMGYLALQAMYKLGYALQALMANAPVDAGSAKVADWFARHISLGFAVNYHLFWIIAGYLIVLAFNAYVMWRRKSVAAEYKV
ncbi:MAG TPA: hypothetical protein VK208_13355 [Pyrinomonadaceae bacterium]|nr:hypothetical protein [Pyrinomonadaceae bacterium]